MAVNYEKIEENKVKLTVTVDKAEFNKALDVAFTKVVKDVDVPGFRKGKLPRNMFEKKFGVESLYEEAINYIVSIEYPKAVSEANIQVVAQPKIDIDYENLGKDKDFVFYATVAVKPEVKLGDYKGIEVEELDVELTDEEVKAELDKLLDQQAELIVKETAAENGDTVVIDYEGLKDNEPFEGGKASNYSLKLGSNTFIPGFEEKLIGINAGESRDVDLTFPEEYHAEELKGKDVVFKVLCHEVKNRQVPELNDEFVKDLNKDNIENVEQLKEDIKSNLKTQKETNAKNHLIDTVVDTASNNAKMNIPQEMIDAEADRLLQDADQRLQQQGLNLDLYLQYTNGTKEGLLEQLKVEATKRLSQHLTLEEISKQENIEVTKEDIDNKLDEIAKTYNVTLEQVKSAFANTENLEDEIKISKTIDFLVDNAVRK